MMSESIDFSLARRVVAAARPCLLPVSEAQLLPVEAYTSQSFWAFEKEAIFSREWLCIGHVSEVPNVGDHLPLTVLDEPVLMVRGDDGIRVLSSVCRHRGHPIVGGVKEIPVDGRCLHGRALVCPYHSWTYNLDGSLRGAPSMSQTTPLETLRRTMRLPEIRSEIWHGLVFVNFDDNAPMLAPQLAKLDAEFRGYGFGELVLGHVFPQQSLGWNWKLHHENALEPYHTPYVHRNHHDAVPAELTQFYDFEDGDGQVMRTTRFAAEDGDLFETSGTRRLPDIEGLSDEQRRRVLFVSIMPSAVAVLQPSFVTITFVNPRSAGTVDTRRLNLYSRAAAASPDFDTIRREQFDRMKTIIMQDQTTQVALQQAYGSRFAPTGRFSHLETAITQLNQWIIGKYDRALAQAGTNEKSPRPLAGEGGAHRASTMGG
jgi:phenylpropionate dioxygenase-like ring-hydroxylating dioxygenase large terminal subunit